MKVLNIIVLFVFLASSAAPAATLATATQAPASLRINPDTLREQLLNGNLSLIQTLDQVYDAKDQVAIARDNLLPSVNLGAMVTGMSSSFALSSVQFLLPFLMPSNWFNFKAAQKSYKAEQFSYQILELNTYSSALSLYETIISDAQIQQIYAQEFDDLKQVADDDQKLVKLGVLSAVDVLPAQAQYELAGVQSSSLLQLQKQEVASLRKALGLPLSTAITIDAADVDASPWEGKPLVDAVSRANAIAPERQQIHYLVSEAKDKKWSTVFSFINGATLSSMVYPGLSSGSIGSPSNTFGTGNFNLGFALFPEIKLASRDIQEVNLLETQLVQSNTEVLESAMKSFQDAESQLELASDAEQAMLQAYSAKVKEYKLGALSMTDLLVARTQETDSQIARVKAQLNMNLQRIVLHRALLTGPFAPITGCDLSNVKTQKKKLPLDQLCKLAAHKT